MMIDGTRLIDRAVKVLGVAGCSEVVAVVREDLRLSGARTVLNKSPEEGLSSSLRIGIEACHTDLAVVMLVDTPGVGSPAIRAIMRALGNGAQIAVATYAGQRGHPVGFGRQYFGQIIDRATADSGVRALMKARPELVTEVPCPGDPSDIDSQADLQRWLHRARNK